MLYSDVRHPRCVLYNSMELSVVIHTVKHNYINSIITMRVLQLHVSALHLGHLQVVIRLDQLYYNAFLGSRGYTSRMHYSITDLV